MNSPLISIVVPIYNSEQTIKMCLDSLHGQTYSLFEVILVNDGSVDRSEELCQFFIKRDDRFSYFYKENGGLSDARNYGLRYAKGDYLMFLDSDDAFSKYCLESMVKIINITNADIISFNFTTDFNGLEDNSNIEFEQHKLKKSNILQEYFFKEVAVTNRCFKRNILEGLSFVKGQISEDVIYLFKCYSKAKIIYTASQSYYYYNQTGISITRSGLSINDVSSVEANITVMKECEKFYLNYVYYAKLQYFKSIFNIINKAAIRGYYDKSSQNFYITKLDDYTKELKKNHFSILTSKSFTNNDKIQISVLCISKKIFWCIKKIISKR